ncbi:MAG: HD domain-containing protein [Proteobacteria bacterium]|nr:HD domain-containing protein [Pseudomonadota bacterium]
MDGHLCVKKSQVHLFKKVSFYHQPKEGEFVLYKKSNERLPREKPNKIRHPQLFILKEDKDLALKELTRALNTDLAKQIASGGLVQVKKALCNIVHEALDEGQQAVMESLPETIEILLDAYGQDHGAMKYLSQIATTSSVMAEHSVNVTALTLQYCFFNSFSDADTARLAICALLHDAGCSKLDKNLVEKNDRLTDEEFKTFTAHPKLGHDMIGKNTGFDISVAMVALEHHERIDGSGYPSGSRQISSDSQLIGLINCYEPLTYRNKSFRKAKNPFDTLQIIKQEVLEGKFSKHLFKQFTSCLTK